MALVLVLSTGADQGSRDAIGGYCAGPARYNSVYFYVSGAWWAAAVRKRKKKGEGGREGDGPPYTYITSTFGHIALLYKYTKSCEAKQTIHFT